MGLNECMKAIKNIMPEFGEMSKVELTGSKKNVIVGDMKMHLKPNLMHCKYVSVRLWTYNVQEVSVWKSICIDQQKYYQPSDEGQYIFHFSCIQIFLDFDGIKH